MLETSDAVADVIIFFGSLSAGSLTFANDPANVTLTILAALGGLSTVVCVMILLLYFFQLPTFKSVAPFVLIASILVEDLFQLVVYILIALSLGDASVPVILGIAKSVVAMGSKFAKIFGSARLQRRVAGADAMVDQAEELAEGTAVNLTGESSETASMRNV